MTSVAVVIVNYRTADLTIDCLASLATEIDLERGDQVYVVDGASGDDSVNRLSNAIATNNWSWATLLPLEHNGGFAFGNNRAIEVALAAPRLPAYVWLLNPDTVVAPGCLNTLRDFMSEHEHVGICGSGVKTPHGGDEIASFRYPNVASEFDLHFRLGFASRLLDRWFVAPPARPDAHATEWVNGASMLVRRQVFGQIGLLDERYFLYYEETDFCRRADAAGWSCWSVPQATVTHFAGSSTGILHNRSEPAPRPSYWFESRRRFFVKHYGRSYAAMTDVVSIAAWLAWNGRRVLQRKPRRDPPGYLTSLFRHSAFLPHSLLGGAS